MITFHVIWAAIHLCIAFHTNHSIIWESFIRALRPHRLRIECTIESSFEWFFIDWTSIICRGKHICKATVTIIWERATFISYASRSNIQLSFILWTCLFCLLSSITWSFAFTLTRKLRDHLSLLIFWLLSIIGNIKMPRFWRRELPSITHGWSHWKLSNNGWSWSWKNCTGNCTSANNTIGRCCFAFNSIDDKHSFLK